MWTKVSKRVRSDGPVGGSELGGITWSRARQRASEKTLHLT